MRDEARGVSSKIIRIGNSQGVRIPKPLLEQAGLEGHVRLRVIEGGIVIERLPAIREGWRGAAKELAQRGDAGLVDEPLATEFDDTEWTWD